MQKVSSLSNQDNLQHIGLHEAVEITTDVSAAETFSRQFNLENETDILTPEEFVVSEEIREEFDASIYDSKDQVQNSEEPMEMENVIAPSEILSHEKLLCEKLFKYSSAAIDAKFVDPVLLELLQKVKTHLYQSYCCIN